MSNTFLTEWYISLSSVALIKKTRVRFPALPRIFLWLKIIPGHIRIGGFCIQLSYFHILPCSVFGDVACISLTTSNGVLQSCLCSYMWFIEIPLPRHRNKWYKKRSRKRRRRRRKYTFIFVQ